MLMKKKLAASLLMIGTSLPLLACADDLYIVNNTDFDSTSKINNKKCTTELLGEHGITHPHSTNKIANNNVLLACLGHPHDCLATVFLTSNCSGEAIANVTFDVKEGIKVVQMLSSKYEIKPDAPFKIELNQVV